ncbi:MAG: sulfotransferase, partial [Candidatus Woesearchaeota archaeon]
GYVGRWRAPSEGDEYWNRFFTRRPAYAPRWSVGEGRILRLQRSISCLVRAARKPVVFKNLYLSVRLWPLVDHFPDALFIVVRRDEVANAHSILKARKELTGSYGSWFSVEPRRYERLKRLPVYKQAVEQIRDIYGLIAEVKEECDGSRFLEIDYEEFCKDTRREMSRMASFFARHGLHPRRRFDIPRRFKVRKKVAIDRRLYKRMAAYARKRS